MNDRETVIKQVTEAQTLLEQAQRMQEPLMPAGFTGAPAVVLPAGWSVASLNMKPKVPDRIRQRVTLGDQVSFCRYVKAHRTPDTALFAEIGNEQGSFTAILDYHQAEGGVASWCTHVATFAPQKTQNWLRWLGQNAKAMGQTEFAQFLENNVADVVNPDGGELLQIINAFEINGTLTFQRVQRLTDGTVKLSYQQEQSAKSGEMAIPEVFTLRFPLFEGEPPTVLKARLRYRLAQAGELKLWFELINPHLAVRDGLQMVLEQVTAACGITPFLGKAELPG